MSCRETENRKKKWNVEFFVIFMKIWYFLMGKIVPSSTLLSSCVTLTASLSILAWRELARSLRVTASLASSPKRSSACLERLESCRIVLARVPFVAASNSEGSGNASGMVPRATCTGSTSLLGSGIFLPPYPRPRKVQTSFFSFSHSPLSRHLSKKFMNKRLFDNKKRKKKQRKLQFFIYFNFQLINWILFHN